MPQFGGAHVNSVYAVKLCISVDYQYCQGVSVPLNSNSGVNTARDDFALFVGLPKNASCNSFQLVCVSSLVSHT